MIEYNSEFRKRLDVVSKIKWKVGQQVRAFKSCNVLGKRMWRKHDKGIIVEIRRGPKGHFTSSGIALSIKRPRGKIHSMCCAYWWELVK